MDYEQFLGEKLRSRVNGASVRYENRVTQAMDFQRDVSAWALQKGRAAIFGGTGVGKCLGKGTLVLMFDGTIKRVEEIKHGDILMGPDSHPREVLSTTSGVEEMYRVIPTKGEPYVVNKSHILSLKLTTNGARKNIGPHGYGKVANVSITDYLASSKKFKHCAKGWRCGVEFRAKPIPLEAYFLGVWLGDGTSSSPSVTTADEEVAGYLRNFAGSFGMKLREATQKDNASITYFITNGTSHGGHKKNAITEALISLGVLNNKHIPYSYRCNDEATRLEVLAGLIDTDGHLSNGCYDYISVSQALANDVAFIARSLGFAAYASECRKKSQNKTEGTYYRVSISGDIKRIPVRISRKKAAMRLQKKNVLLTGIRVQPIGIGRYYGFEISGDRLFMLGDFTVTHNTLIELDIASNIEGNVAIAAPLNVAIQTTEMAAAFGVPDVSYAKSDGEIKSRITLLNYERLDEFDLSRFNGFLADESSILKSLDGKTKSKLIERAAVIPHRFSLSATPAPNDYMELGNQAEFLGIKTHKEMLAEFFVHDGGETSKWRLKGHAREKFWEWLSSWCIMFRMPSDLGYEDRGFVLPPLTITTHFVSSKFETEMLVPVKMALRERQQARAQSVTERVEKCAEIIGDSKEQWIVWCDRNAESEALTDALQGAEEVTGSMSLDEKMEKTHAFTHGKIRSLISKPKILGLGSNYQHSHNAIFCGLSDSYEMFYQAIRRQYRYGQKFPVNVHIVLSEAERIVWENIQRKERDMETMQAEMVRFIADRNKLELHGEIDVARAEYEERTVATDEYTLMLGDCVDRLEQIVSESIGYSIFSPPFASLYTYSDSERDMGNVLNHEGFFAHFSFAAEHLFRAMKPGRLLSFHCMNTPTSKAHDGYIGIRDFRGELIRLFQKHGFIYHSEVCIWKDPVTAMQRTKAIGLLHKQVKKDSALSRQGIADYLVTMRKPGANDEPVSHLAEDYPVSLWQRIASPVWMDISPSDTLQYMHGRENSDERHICPLQLEVIRRGINLWSNPGDTVLSPFAGIGSEGFVALEMNRKFIGIELKGSYFERAVENLNNAIAMKAQQFLFEA